MAKLKRERDRLAESTRARNTSRAYAQMWKRFCGWCASTGRQALPATDETVSLFVAAVVTGGGKVATAQLAGSAIASAHRAEGFDKPAGKLTAAVLGGARRDEGMAGAGKAAITLPQLRRMVKKLNDGTKRGTRDVALVLLGFSSGMRRSEISALDLGDVEVLRKGLRVTVRRSKTDQQGWGRVFGIPYARRDETCPVRAMKAWLAERGDKSGPMFLGLNGSGDGFMSRRLGPEGVADVVKRGVELIGGDPAAYGAHSLRAGLITAGADSGANPLVIMKRTGHRQVQTLKRYYRSADAFAGDPLAKVL